MGNKHKSKRTFDRERKDERRAILHSNEQGCKLLELFGLSLAGDMKPKFGTILMELTIFEGGEWKTKKILPTKESLSQHLEFVSHRDIKEIQALPILDKHRNDLLDYKLKRGKDDLGKYIAKVRPFLLEKGINLRAIPLSLAGRSAKTGEYESKKSIWVLCALPTSRQVAEEYGYSQEAIKELAHLQAWLIPQLVGYGYIKKADQLITAFNGWGALLMPQQKEQMYTSVKKHERHVLNKKVTQLLLFQA